MSDYFLLPQSFAQYGCGAYGQSGYSNCETASETTASGAGSSNTNLPNTGVPIFISTSIAIALIVAAVILFKRRKK